MGFENQEAEGDYENGGGSCPMLRCIWGGSLPFKPQSGLWFGLNGACELTAFLQAADFSTGAAHSQGKLNSLMLLSLFMLLFCFFALSKNAKCFIELRIC